MFFFFQVFDGKTDTENMVKIFCGSVAESVTSTTNVVYVRFYSEKNGLESRFDSIFTAMRALDSGVIADSCDPEVSFFLKTWYILFPKLFWPFVRKICSCDQEKLLKFQAEGREFAKFLRSLEQFIQTVKGQNNFW